MPISIMPTCPKSMENTQVLEIVSVDLKTVTVHTPGLTTRSVEGQAVGEHGTMKHILDLTLVMCADLLFAGKNMKSKTIAMMIIIWESRSIIVEKNIMKMTVCCQETDIDMITTVDITAMSQILRDQKVTITHMVFLRKMIHSSVTIQKDLLGDGCYLQHHHHTDDLPLISNASADKVAKTTSHSLLIFTIARLCHFT